MKICKSCQQVKSLDGFYNHPKTSDGKDSSCKECRKARVKDAYSRNREARSAYEQKRNKRPERKAQRIEVQQRRRASQPVKEAARRAVRKAISDGCLTRPPCEVCGTSSNVQAHHDDYNKPLEIRWLCFKHHREAHNQVVIAS